jgi:hypothetical protein
MNRHKPEVAGLPLICSPDAAWQMEEYRLANDPYLAHRSVDEVAAREIHDRLSGLEREIVSTTHNNGSAEVDDEILRIKGSSGVLLTAEHATKQKRRIDENEETITKGADAGTGALCNSVAIDTNSDALIALGRQTGDPNWDMRHPFKEAIGEIVAIPCTKSHLAIHGLARAHASNFYDDRGFKVLLGVGENPSEATRTLVYDYLVPLAHDLDLRVGVNQPFLLFDQEAKAPRFNKDGTVAREIYMAPDYTTVGYSRQKAIDYGKSDEFSAVEVELSSVIRPRRIFVEQFPTQRDAEVGAYLGYNFVLKAAESVALL